jgi:hypothetical protein
MEMIPTEKEFHRQLKKLGFGGDETRVRGLRPLRGHSAFWAEAQMLPVKYVLADYQLWCSQKGIPCTDTLDSFCAFLRGQGFTVEPDENGGMIVYGMRLPDPTAIEFDKEDLDKFSEMQRLGIWPPNMAAMTYEKA